MLIKPTNIDLVQILRPLVEKLERMFPPRHTDQAAGHGSNAIDYLKKSFTGANLEASALLRGLSPLLFF